METNEEPEGLSYSSEALGVKALFYNKKAMVYVEGPDDINFWDPFFDRDEYEIQSVNGCHNLKPLIDRLEQGEKTFIVACDADYDVFKGKTYTSPLIVTTYGHSIENKMYCPYNLSEVVRKLSKSTCDTTAEILGWYDKFVASAHPLLVRELTNQTYDTRSEKPAIFGHAFDYFSKKPHPCYELDDARIKKFCDDNSAYYPEVELQRVEQCIDEDEREERQLIKGHFLSEAVRRLVNFLSSRSHPAGSKCNISVNQLYGYTVHCTNCRNEDCEELLYLQTSVANAISYLEVA